MDQSFLKSADSLAHVSTLISKALLPIRAIVAIPARSYSNLSTHFAILVVGRIK